MPVDRDKEHDLWRRMWREGDIPFHRQDVHPALVEHSDALLEGGPHRVLLPLCGKSVDLMWLYERGHEVVGIELIEEAVQDFFREHDLQPEIENVDGLQIYRSDRLSIACGDIFEIDRTHVGTIDRIWDRAALIALPAHLRGDYTRHLRQLTGPGWAMLLSAVEYDTRVMAGPPWSVPEEEIRLHFPGTSFELLSRRDALDDVPAMRARGHTWWSESTYLIRERSEA